MIAELRLNSQRLAGNPFEQPEEVVRWMGAMQAQDYGQAVWAIASRTTHASLAAVEQAIAAGKILRTWPQRGTIHFVPAENAKWMLDLSRERMLRGEKSRQDNLQLNEAGLEQSKQLFYEALRGGRRLSRPAILDLLEQHGISTAGQRGYHILYYAAMTGLICIGPTEEKQQTFALLDEWAPAARTLPREEALARLAASYFTSHGPATVQDFAWWAGQTMADARAGLAGARANLSSEKLDGKEYWFSSAAIPAAASTLHLLAGYDEYLLGYTERSAIIDRPHFDMVVPGGNGVFRPIVVVDGRITAAWKRTVKKKGVEISVTPFTQAAHDAISQHSSLPAAAERYSQFAGLPLAHLEVEPPSCAETSSPSSISSRP